MRSTSGVSTFERSFSKYHKIARCFLSAITVHALFNQASGMIER